MAFSVITTTGDGVTVQYALNFTLGILSRDYVKCQVGNEVDGLGDPVYRTLTWINDGLVQIGGTVPANGEVIEFTRTVPKDALQHDYSNGAVIEESNLDESNLQTLMAVHEVLDGRLPEGLANDLDMNGFRITNMGDGTAAQDAVTLTQLEDFTGNAPAYAAAAAASAAASLVSENNSATHETNAELAETNAEAAAAAAAASAALLPLNNYAATTNPTANDDSADGYSIGSKWVNTALSPREAYLCLNATVAGAVWVITTLDAEDLGSAALANTTDFATAAQGLLAATAVQPFNQLSGLFLSNAADTDHDITVAVGRAADSTNAKILSLTSALTKQIDAAWAVGTAAGGLFTGAVANNTTYHFFIIEKDADGSIDAGFDTSLTADNKPGGYTKYRRVGSMRTDGSANIRNFTQYGDEFIIKTPVLDHTTGGAGGTAAITCTLGSIPTGLKLKATVSLRIVDNANYLHLSSLDSTDTAVSGSGALLAHAGNGGSSLNSQIEVWTNTSAQIRARQSTSSANGFDIHSTGWLDTRGKEG